MTVGEEVGQLELDCPDLTEPGDEISCQLWLTAGSQLQLTLEMDQGFTEGTSFALAGQWSVSQWLRPLVLSVTAL